MEKIYLTKHDNFEISNKGNFDAHSAAMLYIKYYPEEGLYGKVEVLFVLGCSTNPNLLYLKVLLKIESKVELKYVINNPLNVSEMPISESKLESDLRLGKNTFYTDLEFKQSIVLSENTYKFDCIYSDLENKTDIVKQVNCSQGIFLQISQAMYWLHCCYPIAINLFFDPKYECSKLFKVTSLIFDGSTETVFAGKDLIMAHFTLYYNAGLNTGEFGFNIPCEIQKGKIERKSLLTDTYIKLYSKDDTILPDRIFNVSSPKKMSLLLTGLSIESGYRFYTLDKDTIERTHWLDWSEHIYSSSQKGK